MTLEERLLKVLRKPHISEKASSEKEERNTFTFKVAINASKAEIKASVYTIFSVKVKEVRTLLVKGKFKRHGKHAGHRSRWKKAYVTLEKGQNLDFIRKTE